MGDVATYGHYRVLRKLGEGGMGEVFLAEHALIGRRAAIKVLRPERSLQRESVERFFNEARATSAVVDPGIVQVFDFGVNPDNTAYIVMEYLEGEQLMHRLRRRGHLAPAEALQFVRQAAGSLAAAHGAGIIHRDLKPENLFIVRDPEASGGERVKILDFGIAKLADTGENRMQTRTGAVMGTPVYMSPEQCNDTSKADHRADIYSLGCVLYHLLTGVPPFDLYGFGVLVAAHLNEIPAPPSARMPGLPPAIDAIVLRCLAKSPNDRFQSMAELQQACELVLAQLPAPDGAALAAYGEVARDPMELPARHAQPTTIGLSSGQQAAEAPRRLGRPILLGATAIAIGAAIAIVMAGRDPKLAAADAAVPAHEVAGPAPARAPAPAAAPAPAPAPPEPPPAEAPAPHVEAAAAPVTVDAGAQAAPPPPHRVPAAAPARAERHPEHHDPGLYDNRN